MGAVQSLCNNDSNVDQNSLASKPTLQKGSRSLNNQGNETSQIPMQMRMSALKKSRTSNIRLPSHITFEYFQSLNMTSNLIKDIYRVFTDLQIHNQKNKYEINLSKDGVFLNHKKIPVTMQKFVKYNWKDVQKIDFSKCMIDNQQWRLFVRNSKSFQNLKIIRLDENNISQLEPGDLQNFPNLKYISFGDYDEVANPLSKQSKKYLKKYQENHPEPEFWIQFIND